MPTPPYRQIADDLRQRILSGELAPGEKVPSENAIVARYNVAGETARKALNALAAEGLTVARRGSGTRVREFRPILRRGTKRLAQSIWGEGRSIWDVDLDGRPLEMDRLTVDEAVCPPHLVGPLGLEAGARVCVRDRRYLVDGEPVMLATSTFPMALVGGSRITEPDTGLGGAPARLAELGYAPAHFREVARSRMPLPDEAEALGLGAGTPVTLIVRYALAEGGLPVEVTEMTLDSSRYLLEWEFSA